MKTKRILANLLVLAMLAALFVTNAFAAVEPVTADNPIPESADVIILHTNDTHGYVKTDDKAVIGLDYIAGIRDAVEETGTDVMLVDVGDFSNGQPFAALTKGESVLEVLIAGGWSYGTLGNHEFDFYGNVEPLIAQAAAGGMKILSANVKRLADGKTIAPASALAETASGVKIGYIGATTPETAYKANPTNTEDYDFGTIASIIADVKAEAAALREQGAEIIIVLSHLGIEASDVGATSIALAEALEPGEVDIILDAHSHSTPDKDAEVNGTWIVSAGGESYSYLGVVAFTKTDDGYSVNPTYIDFEASRLFEPDAEVTDLINELYTPVDEMMVEIVANSPVLLNGQRADARTKETNLANTIADAIREFAGADIGFQNGGGVRADIPAGDVSYGQIFTAFPFGNVVYKASVKGSDIWAAIEHGVSVYPAQNGGFSQVSGMTYTFDAGKPAGARVTAITVGGKPIDLNAEYTVATNDFTAKGGDGYTMFNVPFQSPLAFTPPASSNGSTVLCDVLAWYLNEYGPSAEDGRIVAIEAPVVEPEPEPTPAPAPVPAPAPKPTPDTSTTVEPAPSTVTYTVVNGDNLTKIAKKYNTTWRAIYEKNKTTIKDPNKIYIGQVLLIP